MTLQYLSGKLGRLIMDNDFRTRLRSGEVLLGTMVTLPSPTVCEILADAGFDWLFLDGEHGPFDNQNIAAILQAVGDRAASLVRIPEHSETPIKKSLDLGATGIIAPQVNTAEQASAIVRWCKYPPQGCRGVGAGRAHGYGSSSSDYLRTANDAVTVVVQAEHVQAVENIASIVEVEGIDCVLVGPYDLSASMGRMGEVEHPSVVAAIDQVASVCQMANMRLGFFGTSHSAVQPYIERGFSLITVGVDCMMIGSAAKELLSSLR